MNKIIKATDSDAGTRLDIFLAEELKESYSRSQIKRCIKEGAVKVNDRIRKPNYIISESDQIDICVEKQEQPDIKPEDIPLDIVYEDDHILIVNKPSGMVVHPAPGNPDHTLVNALLFHTKGKLSHIDSSTRPGIVHRLDKEVSGLMVAAKTDSANKVLVDGFKNRSIKRNYIAFAQGVIAGDSHAMDLPIGRSARDRKKMAVKFLNSKEALTTFKVLARFPDYTKVKVSLGTGRTHQIRVHMSYMGHPIIGDSKYGGPKFERIALYAAQLKLKHPKTGKYLHFSIDMPEELRILDKG
ncbi:RluA family pseudouridine synthase [Candidatus Omnitrophota bacterium]